MKIFISSLILGMEELRDAAERAAQLLGHEVIRAEAFEASPDSPRVACLTGVRQSDAMILIMGKHYGAVQPSGMSATHEEYREAHGRCSVLVMVQDDVVYENRQSEFLSEVRDWKNGNYTGSFTDASQLHDSIVKALHKLDINRAAGAVDTNEMLQRGTALLPCDSHSFSGKGQLALVLTGGPKQKVLRPAELECRGLKDSIHKMAMFGEFAVLTTQDSTDTRIVNDSLVFKQSERSISIREDGSIKFLTEIKRSNKLMPVIIEEDISGLITHFLKFANTVLEHIDDANRLPYVTILATILGAGHLTWRTSAEHAESPDRMLIDLPDDSERKPVYLSPPNLTRSDLSNKAEELATDLMIMLRRQRQSSWSGQC